jgi:ribosomal protein S18 acetylase RimI-like enzyme
VSEAYSPIVIRVAKVADAATISAIGSVAFPAVHDEIVGREFSATVVEQTYSVGALTECITRCAEAGGAAFFVAERDGEVVGYLHYDSEGVEPELHRIYVDPGQKRGGIGSALMQELHTQLSPGSSYVLLVAEANTAARSFYERHGLVIERHVEGNSHYSTAMNLELESQPRPASGVLMRFTKAAT